MLLKSNFCSQLCCTLSLTDRRFLVMTGHVMEPDAVVVEVVEDGEAGLVPLPVVGLWPVGAAGVGPVHGAVAPAARPSDAPPAHAAARPEVLLPLPAHQPQELPLLAAAVDRDGLHVVLAAEVGGAALGEGGAAEAPGDEVVPALEPVVRLAPPAAAAPAALRPVEPAVSQENLIVLWPGPTRGPGAALGPTHAKEIEEAKLRPGGGQGEGQGEAGQGEGEGLHLVEDT